MSRTIGKSAKTESKKMDKQSQAIRQEKLLIALRNPKDVILRKGAAEQLGEQGMNNPEVVQALRNAAESDTNNYVRDSARHALEKLGGEERIEAEVVEDERTVENQLTYWQTIGIGGLVGFIPILLLLAMFLGTSYVWDAVGWFYLLILLGPPALLGAIIGAVIGKKWKNSKTAVWIGAVLGVVFGAVIGVVRFEGM